MAPSFSSLRSKQPDDAKLKIDYWEDILKNSSTKLGCSIAEYKNKVVYVVGDLKTMADVLDKVAQNVGITKATGGGASILGGTMALGGLALAPFTGGASLTLTLGGIGLGAAGGVTTLGAVLTQHFSDKDKLQKAKEMNKEVISLTNLFREVLNAYMEALEKFCEVLAKENCNINDAGGIETTFGRTRSTVNSVCTISSKTKEVIQYYRELKAIKTLAGTSGTKAVRLLIGTSRQLATDMAAPGLQIGSKVLISAGSTGARALSASFSLLGIGMGIYDCIDAANDIKNGSEHAKNLRESACCLDKAKSEIIELYDGLMME